MIMYIRTLHRYFDTKKGIISKRDALKGVKKLGMNEIPTIKGKKHPKHSKKRVKRNVKRSKKHSSNHKNYKKLYLAAERKLHNRPVRVETGFHSFLAHRSKTGEVTYKTVERNLNDYLKNHSWKLMVVGVLNSDGHNSFVDACGDVNGLEVRGFAQRDLIPGLIGKYTDGYND